MFVTTRIGCTMISRHFPVDVEVGKKEAMRVLGEPEQARCQPVFEFLVQDKFDCHKDPEKKLR